MLQEDTVQEVLARLARGEKIKAIARELEMDRHTVKRWRRLGRGLRRSGHRIGHPGSPAPPFEHDQHQGRKLPAPREAQSWAGQIENRGRVEP